MHNVGMMPVALSKPPGHTCSRSKSAGQKQCGRSSFIRSCNMRGRGLAVGHVESPPVIREGSCVPRKPNEPARHRKASYPAVLEQLMEERDEERQERESKRLRSLEPESEGEEFWFTSLFLDLHSDAFRPFWFKKENAKPRDLSMLGHEFLGGG